MKTILKVVSIFFLLSISSCIQLPNADFQELETMVKTEFNVNKDKEVYFKYKLNDTKGPIAIQFLLANLYTIEVLIYKTSEDTEPFMNYTMAKEPFKEIDVTDFGEYVYIVIRETFQYYYKDYITIYNPSEIIDLKSGEPLVINKFLSNGKYEMTFSSELNSTLLYNTYNTISSNRTITITTDNDTHIIDTALDNQIKLELTPGYYSILVEDYFDPEKEEGDLQHDFSLVVYEKEDLYGFNQLTQNIITKTNYIYSNEPQQFYYYVDISNNQNSNTINFKLNFKYYKIENDIKFYTKIIYLESEITESDLESNIPTENENPESYDSDSDEYYRIYFHDEKTEYKYKYLLVKVEITEETYYKGSNNFDVSLGKEVEIIDYINIENNDAQTIQKKVVDYIPTYLKLKFNSNDKYLLTSQNQDLTTFIKGDLITADNKVNEDYLFNTNEIIVVLSGIPELTIKLFGSTDSEVKFYVEKIDNSQLQYVENERNNDVYEITMNENEVKYVLGTFDYEEYAFGEYKINYYATIESGEFEVYYKNYTSLEGKTLFPTQESQSQEFNKEIIFETNVDLITIKCKKSGSLSIRPVTKDFDETTHLLEQNSVNQITLYDSIEIVQLTTTLGQNNGTVYFSILSLDGQEIKISPDTPGLFEEQTIKNNELFAKSADLSKYKMDQLAIKVSCSSAEKNIEILEIIPNEFNTYKKLDDGENKEINKHNVYFQFDENVQKLKLILENLQNKTISYGVVNAATNDSNYLLSASKYPNSTTVELKDNEHTLEITNPYYNIDHEKKPYTLLLVSISGEDKDLSYNAKIEKGEPKEEDDDHTVLIVFICLISAIVIGFITLALFMIVIKKRNKKNNLMEDQNEMSQKLCKNNLGSEVDP